MQTPLTIIVPAKHEEDTIIPALESLAAHVRTPHKIIVINVSDTKDKTADVVSRYAKTRPHIRLLRKIHPHGTFGMALSLGFHAVKSGAVVPFMADSCDDPRAIDRMYTKILDGWDVVCASRYMRGGKKTGGPAVQSFFSRCVCTSLRLATGIPTHDISNAFKMYKTSIIKKINILPESGVEASMMIALQAYFSGAKITEIPTMWRGRSAGESKFKLFERAPQYLRVCLWALYKSLV
jgi:glycosyltransferase involved in cell wall biosynthesis